MGFVGGELRRTSKKKARHAESHHLKSLFNDKKPPLDAHVPGSLTVEKKLAVSPPKGSLPLYRVPREKKKKDKKHGY